VKIFRIVWWYLLFYGSITRLHEHHNTTNNYLRATFTSFCNKHFLAHLKLLKKFLTTFWTTKTGWEMTSQLIRWSLLEPVTVYWRNNVSVQCSWRDCERFASLYNVTVVLSISVIFLHSPAIAYGRSSANNLTYASNTANFQKKCSYRSRLRRWKILSIIK